MKRRNHHILLVLATFLGACDPGMSIRQTDSMDTGAPTNTSSAAGAVLQVKTTHPLIGETWYAPRVTITNRYDKPIKVTKLELQGTNKTYANTPKSPDGGYPVTVPSGREDVLDAWFDLDASVKEIFSRPVQLQAHYELEASSHQVNAKMEGGPLNLDR